MSLIVKICGLSTPDALDVALEAGADMVGFVFFPPSPRHVGFETARALGRRVRGRAQKVALTVDADDALLDAVVEALQPDMLQLHGKETPARVAALKTRFGLPVMKAIAVESARRPRRRCRLTPASPTGCCSTRARRARRPGPAGSARHSIGIFWKISIPACRSCCRAGSMPAMSRGAAHHARARRRCVVRRRARAGRKGSGQDSAPSSAPPARRRQADRIASRKQGRA